MAKLNDKPESSGEKLINKLNESQKQVRLILNFLKVVDEQLSSLIEIISQLKTDVVKSNITISNIEWTPKSLNWSRLTRETLLEINQGTVQHVVEQLQLKSFVPSDKYRIAYQSVQQSLWSMKSLKIVKKTGSGQNAIWELSDYSKERTTE